MARRTARDLAMENHWFEVNTAPLPLARTRSSSTARKLAEPIGHAGWALLLGALSGGLGGFAMLAAAERMLRARHSDFALDRALSWLFPVIDVNLGGRQRALIVAVGMGAVLGAVLGCLSRRLLRIVPRLFFFSVLAPVLWTFVQTCVIGRLNPELAQTLPYVPLLVGSLAYGACLALVPPVRARERSREFVNEF